MKFRQLYDHLSAGGKEDAEHLEDVPSHLHATVRADRQRIQALRSEGSLGPARQLARDLAAQLEARVPDGWEPEQSKADDQSNETPRELAARVRRQ